MKDLPVRKNIRLKDYDYSKSGYYFITICTRCREFMFGTIENNVVILEEYGIVAERNLINIPLHIQNVRIDKYVVMPDHVHLILVNSGNVGTRYIASGYVASEESRTPCMASLREKSNAGNVGTRYIASGCIASAEKSKQTISKAIQQYKASVSRDTGVTGLWQPRFYDHIIRDEAEYQRIWQYIDENPARWTAGEHY